MQKKEKKNKELGQHRVLLISGLAGHSSEGFIYLSHDKLLDWSPLRVKHHRSRSSVSELVN